MTNQNIPGDAVISTVSLFTDKGVLNMVEHVVSMSIYESITTPGVIVELAVHDTTNFAAILPIVGTERMNITLNAPGRKPMKYELVVTGYRNGMPSDNMRSKGYILTASTVEVVRNRTSQVSKAYNTNVSNMVKDIIKSYLYTTKKINVQETRGIQKIIVPSLQPFDAIDMLRRRSMSITDKSSSYVFFENQTGFHFKTVESLMAQSDVGDRVFTVDPTINTDIKNPIFRNAIAIEQGQQFDVIDRLSDGGMSTSVKKFDYKTLSYTSKESKFNPSQYKNADGTLKDPDAQTMQQYAKPGTDIWVAHDSGNPDTFLSEGLGPRASGSSVYGQGNLLLHVFGDSELTAGQLIEVRMPETTTVSQAPKDSDQLSGKWVITHIHHMIVAEGTNPRYTCAIEAIKGGYKEKSK